MGEKISLSRPKVPDFLADLRQLARRNRLKPERLFQFQKMLIQPFDANTPFLPCAIFLRFLNGLPIRISFVLLLLPTQKLHTFITDINSL